MRSCKKRQLAVEEIYQAHIQQYIHHPYEGVFLWPVAEAQLGKRQRGERIQRYHICRPGDELRVHLYIQQGGYRLPAQQQYTGKEHSRCDERKAGCAEHFLLIALVFIAVAEVSRFHAIGEDDIEEWYGRIDGALLAIGSFR